KEEAPQLSRLQISCDFRKPNQLKIVPHSFTQSVRFFGGSARVLVRWSGVAGGDQRARWLTSPRPSSWQLRSPSAATGFFGLLDQRLALGDGELAFFPKPDSNFSKSPNVL